MSRVVVTGATGFVGHALCAQLQASRAEVVVVSRSPAGATKRLPGAAAYHAWPDHTQPFPRAALEGVDAVVHLSGEPVQGRWTETKKAAIRDSRVIGTRGLVAAMREVGAPARFVSASAIGYYGDRGDEVLTEDSAPGDDFLAEVCKAWEAEALAAEALGSSVTRLRVGIVLAKGGGALDAMLTPFKLGVGGKMGSGRQWWSWIHRDDLLELLTWALAGRLTGAVNGTAPEPVPQMAFAKALAKQLKRPSFMPAPKWGLRLALGEFSTELITSKRVVPAAAEAASFAFRHPQLQGALAEALG